MNLSEEIIRHFLSSIRYRFMKAVSDTTPEYGSFDPGQGIRSPHDIVLHMTHVLYYAQSFLGAPHEIKNVTIPAPEKFEWKHDTENFIQALEEVDFLVAKNNTEVAYLKILLQGPLSDVMTHIGQLSMLRRASGSPLKGENFMEANIITGLIPPTDII